LQNKIDSNERCAAHCSHQRACVGYAYIKDGLMCYLFWSEVSDDDGKPTCPTGWKKSSASYTTPKSSKDLVSYTGYGDEWKGVVCYGKTSENCGEGFAYHSGTMVNDNAPAKSPQECQQQCASLSTCKFWDLGEGFCRLRSEVGLKGLQAHLGYAYGSKNCLFEATALAPATAGAGNGTSTGNN